jgi:DNA-binding LacI/PurR family transcriptional regulator
MTNRKENTSTSKRKPARRPPGGTGPAVALRGTRVTSTELAGKLGLSRATVSIVLRGDAERRKIPAKTVERVMRAAERYNYVPNQIAQRLRKQRSGVVSVIVVNFRMDWAEAVMDGVLEVLEAKGLTPFVATHRNDPQRQERELLAALSRRDDGVICQPIAGHTAIYERLRKAGIPVVFLGDYPADMPHVSRVAWDSGEAARVAVQHLIDTGRRRIAYLGMHYPLHMHIARFAAYEDAIRDAGLPLNPRWVVHASAQGTLDDTLDPALARFFAPGAEHPDAIFVINDGLALPMLERLAAAGIRVPQDVAVIGMGDVPMARHVGIGLSTVVEPVREMGVEAAQAMAALIGNPALAPIERIIVSNTLRARRTTGAPPAP